MVTLGNFATKLLLNTTTGITRVRGRAYPWWLGAHLIPTFHPSFALRNGARTTDVLRADFRLMRQMLDQPPPGHEETDAGREPHQATLWS